MDHPSHRLKSYTGDVYKRLLFCSNCGKDAEEGLDQPCKGYYIAPIKSRKNIDKTLDTKPELT